MKKKILATILAAAMTAMMVTGCGNTEAATTEAPAAEEATEESTEATEEAAEEVAADDASYVVGICQLVQHPALDAATQGFKDAITDAGLNVTFDEQNAQGDSATCATIVNSFVSNNVNLILANATAPLQAAAAGTTDIPILGTSVTDYATGLDIDNWAGLTGRNISGTSDLAPLSEQAAMLNELFPDATKVGVIYCSAEANSQYQADVIKTELEALGKEVTFYSFVDTNDVATVVQNAADNSEVLYVPTDNTAASNTEIIDSICRPAGVPIIAGEEGICAGCGIATLSISYYDLGYTTGKMAVEILANGADVSAMEIQYAPNVTKKYNEAVATDLGIEIPEGYEAIATE